MNFKRLLYLPYYLIKTPWGLFFQYVAYVKKRKQLSSLAIYTDVIRTIFKYNACPLDYFSFRFSELSIDEREDISCTGFMYEYQLAMNPVQYRNVLLDKVQFLKHFKELIGREWATLSMLTDNPLLFSVFSAGGKKKVVIKNSQGQAGKEVEIVDIEKVGREGLLTIMRNKNYDLVEAYVEQHSDLMEMSPSGLNTIRIVTQYFEDQVLIVFALLRVSVDSTIDNLSADHYSRNFGCAVDLQTGKICKPGTYLNAMMPYEYYHPLTRKEVIGFQIPYWNECLQLVTLSANLTPQNRSIGWDVAITNKGPLLIEGNHNWNNLSLVPGKKGYKKDFIKYLSSP